MKPLAASRFGLPGHRGGHAVAGWSGASGMGCLALLLVWLGAPPVFGQVLVEGTVRDAATGEPLPAANVHVEGTYRGTITNEDGWYALRLDGLPAVLVVRYIGYATQRRTLRPGDAGRQDFDLEPVAYELDEVVVTGEDPAVEIMRQVIARKQQWRAALQRYRAEVYNRFTLENDTGIVSIVESLTEAFWDRERGAREVVRARRRTSNLDFEAFLPAAFFVENLYDDDVEVAGYRLIGVTHPDALRHYRFTLEGTRVLDDRTVYDIAVRPAGRLKSAFEGRVAVLDEAFALVEAELRPGEAFLFPPPVRAYEVTYRQQFSRFGGDFWLPVDFRSEALLKIDVQGLLTFPLIRIRQVARFTNYEVNGPLPDTLYRKIAYLTIDSVAVAADTLLDRPGVAVPLSGREAGAYATIDSTMTLEKAYRPRGPLAFLVKVEQEDDAGRRGRTGRDRGLRPSLQPELWYNRVDEAHLALGLGATVGRHLALRALGGYKTGPNRWTYGGEVELRGGTRGRGWLALRYRDNIEPRFPYQIHERFFNSFGVLTGGTDYFDYYGNEKWTARAGYHLPFAATRIEVRYNRERHFSVERTTGYSLIGSGADPRPNPAVEEGRLRSLGVRLVFPVRAHPGDDDLPLPLGGQRRVQLQIEHSDPGLLGSDFDFTRLWLLAEWRFETFFRRRLLPMALDVRVVAATHTGTLPPQRYAVVEAAGGLWQTFGGLRTLESRPYEGERVLALFWEHHFRTVPFELLGLRRLAGAGLGLIVHGGHARTFVSAARRDELAATLGFTPRRPEGFHHELGLSLNGLFGLFRIDVTKRLDAPGLTAGLGLARIF
ncbi:DUF5686 and carboxypeptidase regulatory-like domain-containing protein [Rhodocaloribacter litoris]|uniref:DUF5686 and carboxypeptidase-like regulatory domain-containing protein n=1 Tax=Rhodocaloribacter litoris TaxID=2558931 RepID=UPI001E426418|nr:DUF5686 and carboxypeptidase-like regulatory domain-containing protein [Rhodocaloribacter litoris]QXD15974.1 DUF5686 and carboxypeptidase regulatory-like domain-containing protein [Rhodocaloribacter litoris]